ncbi:hypothetical protein ElyMa_004909500 [Elysia marginata]|uniref:Uncharacterized protein n=1 Tax=Elysia marginata TaxID=1093978 RepID=A0AAV4J1C1_9GAST|nr:hypothetical protein ElyMa_004909500 [Elysia marginata]
MLLSRQYDYDNHYDDMMVINNDCDGHDDDGDNGEDDDDNDDDDDGDDVGGVSLIVMTPAPQHNRQDGLHQMDRKGQTTLFRLRTGHNRLKAHLYKTYRIGHPDFCSCGEAAETVELVLQDYQNYRMLRQAVWSSPTDLQTKIWDTIEELEKTNSFIHQT